MKIIIFLMSIILLFSKISAAQTKCETGIASYYSNKLHGCKTASGEKYDKNLFTAAHKTLPFQSIVKITNLENNKSVLVRINDRGPYSKNRIIDVSGAAAEKIGLIKSGLAKVKIEVIENSKTPDPEKNKPDNEIDKSNYVNSFKAGKTYNLSGEEKKPCGYGVQVASLTDTDKVKSFSEQLKQKFKNIYIEVEEVKSKKTYRIIVGAFKDKTSVEKELDKIKKAGYSGFVKKYKN